MLNTPFVNVWTRKKECAGTLHSIISSGGPFSHDTTSEYFHIMSALLKVLITWIVLLALLLSVTLILTVYSAGVCREKTRIRVPKVYDSYKSLSEDPPAAIIIGSPDSNLIKRKKYARSSEVQDDLHTYSFNYRNYLAHKLISTGKNLEEIFIVEKRDPSPLVVMKQGLFSNSILNKPGGREVLKTATISMEHSLTDVTEQHSYWIKASLPRGHVMRDGT